MHDFAGPQTWANFDHYQQESCSPGDLLIRGTCLCVIKGCESRPR